MMYYIGFFSNRQRTLIGRLLVLLCVTLVSATLASAQTSRGTVTGTVKDAAGAVIPGATVTLVSESTTVERTVTTNDEGFYRFDAVDLGTYSVRIGAPNFSTALKTGVTVAANQTANIDADLQVGSQQAVVEVVAGGSETLQTESPVRGGNISTRQITELPVGSNPTSLALTLPGVSTNRTGVGIDTFSVNGARGRSNNFLIDGTENNDISVAGQGFQIVNRDAVAEVSVQTGNYDSEFGRAGGAIVNVITRSGTSNFHGNLAFQYDTSSDDAITSSQARNARVLARGKPLFNDEKVYSGTFGGPIFFPNFGEGGPVFNTDRSKNFFFVGYLENRFRSPGATSSLVVPTAAGRATLQQFASNPNVATYLQFTANAIAPTSDRTPVSLNNSNLAPALQTRGSVEIGTFFREYTTFYTTKQFQARTDHAISQNDQLSFRFLYDNQDQPFGGAVGFPGFEVNYAARYRNFLVSETHTFSPTLTNELRLAYNFIQYSFPLADETGVAANLPQFSPGGGLTAFGIAATFPQGRTANNYQVQDTVTKVFGDHTIRGGVDYLRQIATQIAPANTRGSLTYAAGGGFTSLGNFVDDFGGSNGTAARVFGSNVYSPQLHRIATFVQDRWKASDELTLSLGVRYEYFGVPYNRLRTPAYTGLFNVNPATYTGPFSEPNQVKPDRNNFAPSFGLAYSPSYSDGIRGMLFGEKKTVFRIGYNIGYDSFFNNIASNAVASSPNLIATTNTSTVTGVNPRGIANFSSQFPTVAAKVLPTSAQTLIDPNLVNPYYQRWSVGLQRSLPYDIVLDISYVGSKGTKLFANEDANPLVRPELRITPAGYPRCDLSGNSTVTAAQATTLFPTGSPCPTQGRLDNIQGSRTVRTNGGDSNYHAGQLEVRRRFTNNFLITGAYTFSKNINNADDVFAVGLGGSESSFQNIPAAFGGLRTNRGLSVDDRTHRLAFTYVVESPFFRDQKGVLGRILGGFQLSGVTTYESGVPFSVLNGFDSDGLSGANRPNYNPNGQRGVRAIPVVDANNFIVSYYNPEIITGLNAQGQPIYATIDPNTAEFIVNPTFVAGLAGSVAREGSLGRNTERTPSVSVTNLTLLKRTRFRESMFLEFRTELFNAFNHPNFPGTGLITSAANSVTQRFFLNPDTVNTTGGGRTIRYQVKFVF